MFEVIVSLIILSVRSHAGSLSSLLVLFEGFSCGLDWLAVSTHSYHHTQSLFLWGLLGLKHFVSLRIVSLEYGFIHDTDVYAVGYDDCYAKWIS